ncbi:predicted protein [Postia placenta Mad-698-R]|nr:predicted protein [Postia placenta Mad-698-R]
MFLIYHLWEYDRFHCLRWSAGRQPGAFKRVMTYSYLGSVPLFVVYSIATTVIKYKEGTSLGLLYPSQSTKLRYAPGFVVMPDHRILPRPVQMYGPHNRAWVIPLNFIFSCAWALELVTHLEGKPIAPLARVPHLWLTLSPWLSRSIVAILGMPLVCVIARRDLMTMDAYIFLAGSSGSLSTTLVFLYVLWRFPRFIRHVKAEGADPSVVVRLTTFLYFNRARVVFRFLFTVPLLMLAIDGITGTKHPLNTNLFSTGLLPALDHQGGGVQAEAVLVGAALAQIGARVAVIHQHPLRVAVVRRRPLRVAARAHAAARLVRQLGRRVVCAWVVRGDESLLEGQSMYQGQGQSIRYQGQYADMTDDAPPYHAAHAYTDSVAYAYAQPGPGPHTLKQQAQLQQRHPFPHAIPGAQLLALSPAAVRVAIPPPAASPRQEWERDRVQARGEEGQHLMHHMARSASFSVRAPPTHVNHPHPHRASLPASKLHPYVRTFTSPIDLVDLDRPEEYPRSPS